MKWAALTETRPDNKIEPLAWKRQSALKDEASKVSVTEVESSEVLVSAKIGSVHAGAAVGLFQCLTREPTTGSTF